MGRRRAQGKGCPQGGPTRVRPTRAPGGSQGPRGPQAAKGGPQGPAGPASAWPARAQGGPQGPRGLTRAWPTKDQGAHKGPVEPTRAQPTSHQGGPLNGGQAGLLKIHSTQASSKHDQFRELLLLRRDAVEFPGQLQLFPSFVSFSENIVAEFARLGC